MEEKENQRYNLPHLVLNFDINKTVILKDKTKNYGFESCVKSCLVDYAWGTFDESKKSWTLTENYLSHKKPKPELINYYKYMKIVYKSKTEKEIPDREERMKKNKEIKAFKDNLFLHFLDEGQPGEKLQGIYNEYLKKVKIPKDVMNEINKENSIYPSFFKELYENDYIFIFPSLFRTMIELKSQNRIFTIIFRTFGLDFDDVIKEYNSFCEGKHPLFNGLNEKYPNMKFNGENGSKDYCIQEKNIGIIYRFDENIDNIYLVLGCLKRIFEIKTPDELYTHYKDRIGKGEVNIIKGGKEIFEFINKNATEGKLNSFCINDHYDTWYKYDKKSICGKPMFIDTDNKNVEVFFFDDNITQDEFSIVDSRNIKNGKSIVDKNIKDKYLIDVDTLKATEDEYYFVDIIKQAEK